MQRPQHPKNTTRFTTRLICAGVIAAGMIAPLCAHTETHPTTPPTRRPRATVPEITVSATRVERFENRVSTLIKSFSADDLRRSTARSLDEFLRRLPGFSLFRRTSSLVAHPTTQGVSLRGIGPSGSGRTLVVLDGIPINDTFGGWVYWTSIPIEAIERIEIVAGGGSSVWGNFALGGIVSITTKDPPTASNSTVHARIEHGDRNTVDDEFFGATSYDSKLGTTSLAVDARYFRSDGYTPTAPRQRGTIDRAANSEHGLLWLRASVEPIERWLIRFDARAFSEERGNGTPMTGNETRAGHFRAGMRYTQESGSRLHADLFGSIQTFTSAFSAQSDDRNEERPALDQFRVPSTAVGAQVLWSSPPRQRVAWSIGADLLRAEGKTNEDFFFGDTGFQRRRRAGGRKTNTGLHTEGSMRLSSRWSVDGGLRLDYWSAQSGSQRELDLTTGQITRSDRFHDRDDWIVSPRFGARFELTDRLAVFGSVFRGFRSPTLNELYRPFRVRSDITAANPTLKTETASGTEFGFSFSNEKLDCSVAGFLNRLEHPIINASVGSGPGNIAPCGFVPSGGSCRQRTNLERSRSFGLESDLRFFASANWIVHLSHLLVFSDVRNSSPSVTLAGKRTPQIPKNRIRLELAYDRAPWTGSFELRWIGSQFEDDLNTRRLSSYAVANARLSRRLGDHWTVYGGIENALDRRFAVGRTASGLVTVGPPALLQIGARFDFSARAE